MTGIYSPGNNHTYKSLPAYRSDYIKLQIKTFLHLFKIQIGNWPLDCIKLLEKMKETQVIPFFYGFFRLPDKYEAITNYHSDQNVYLMQINQNNMQYPFETSANRRLNFTIAHEIGHIMLNHLKVPRNLKTKEDIRKEEQEANEFAGQLLMPDKLLACCSFNSISSVAEFFNVSDSALMVRLGKTYRLDMLHQKKSNVCSNCGNESMDYTAKFCCICGIVLENNKNGVLRVSYFDGVKLDKNGEACSCPVCNNSDISFTGRCTKCSTPLYNYCSSIYSNKSKCSYTNPGNARYCEMCGSETSFYSIGLLKPWEEVRKNLIPEFIQEDEAEYSIFV